MLPADLTGKSRLLQALTNGGPLAARENPLVFDIQLFLVFFSLQTNIWGDISTYFYPTCNLHTPKPSCFGSSFHLSQLTHVTKKVTTSREIRTEIAGKWGFVKPKNLGSPKTSPL